MQYMMLLVMLVVSGCATPQFTGGESDKQRKRDAYDCRVLTHAQTGHREGWVGNTWAYNREFSKCMESRGYEEVED